MTTIKNMLAFRARVRRERPDVVHAWFNDAAVLVPIFCGGRRSRVFTSRRDMGFWHTPGYLAMLRVANRRAEGIVCNSRAVAELTAEREKTPRSKIVVIHNGISSEHPVAGAGHQHIPPERPDLAPKGGFNACLVANLRPIKRVEDLVEAAAMVIPDIPDAHFWIAGETLDADYERALRSRVTALGLEAQVHFLGESKDPLGLMRRCQVGVLCSESEGLSNTLLEYLLCGLPVVCSDVGGNPELIEHETDGFLYRCGDVQQLADSLARLAKDPALRQSMSEAAQKCASGHSVEAMSAAHLALYQRA